MRTNILKYGFIAGGIMVLIPVLTEFFIGYGADTFKIGEVIGYSTIILSSLIILLAIGEYQKVIAPIQLKISKVFLIGLGVSSIAGIMFGIYNLVYVIYIQPDFMEQYYQYSIDNLRNSGQTPAAIEQSIQQLEAEKSLFMNPALNFILMFATVFIVGLLVTLASAGYHWNKARKPG